MGQTTYEKLVAENQKLHTENKKQAIEIENLKLHINALNRIIFGSKRESTPKEENVIEGIQTSIFGEIEDSELKNQVEEKTEEIIVHRKKNAKKQQSGIKKSELKNIEQETIIFKLEEEEQKCPKCGSNLKKIGTEVVRQEIEYVPAKLKLKTYVREVYKCEECGTEKSEKETATIIKTKVPNALLTHSFVSSSLATEVIYQKYYLGVPLYRQEKMWDDKGLILPRNMMANWNIKITEYYLESLWNMMQKQMKQKCELLHCDETTMQCNKEPGRKATSNSYMWVLASGQLEKIKGVIFHYSPSRSAETAKEFLKGVKGILVTDGYAAYNGLEVSTHAECWAHARRYFYESIPLTTDKKMDTTCDGYKGIEYCDKLFKIEQEIAEFSVLEKEKIRKEKSKPILEEFFEWVTKTMTEKIVLNKKLSNALTYAKNQQKELSEFLNDGRIPLTNSLAERAIRPFAVHRKNWLFADSVEGAKANAVMYSLIESAKLNKLNIYKYIKYLLDELPRLEGEQAEENIEKYLPWSEELPEEIKNFEGEYKELKIEE